MDNPRGKSSATLPGSLRASQLIRLGLVAACLAALIAGGTSASAASRSRHIELGVLGNPDTFDAMTRQHTSSRLLIIAWNQGGGSQQYFANLFATMRDEPMLGIGIPNGSTLTPLGVARGQGDSFLVALNQAVATWGKPIYIRPLAEMNGWWNSYCAYDKSGSSRGPRYATKQFRKAFARIYLIVHGGASTNARLHKLGMPPVQGTLTPAPLARVIWNPQGFGDPDTPQNSAAAYYPGNAFVDVVGDDLYDQRFKAEWPAADALYRAHPHKPFAFPEWGLWGIDDPGFVRTMASFVRAHRRTVLISYFNSTSHSTWDLGTKPRSRAAYRRYIAPLGR
jgi:hypothetical protein